LARVLEPREMAPLLAEGSAVAEHVGWLPRVEVMQYRFHRRCVLRYTVQSPDSPDPKEVIGKVHHLGVRAVQEAYALNTLHPQAAACGVIVPKALKVVEEWGLLLMERVPGTVMKPVVKQA